MKKLNVVEQAQELKERYDSAVSAMADKIAELTNRKNVAVAQVETLRSEQVRVKEARRQAIVKGATDTALELDKEQARIGALIEIELTRVDILRDELRFAGFEAADPAVDLAQALIDGEAAQLADVIAKESEAAAETYLNTISAHHEAMRVLHSLHRDAATLAARAGRKDGVPMLRGWYPPHGGRSLPYSIDGTMALAGNLYRERPVRRQGS